MAIKFEELPEWSFGAEEVSIGAYKAFGSDIHGRKIEKIGTDPEILINECMQYAIHIKNKSIPSQINSRTKPLTNLEH
jgi:hypothetical protein